MRSSYAWRARARGVEVMHFTNPLNFTRGHFKSVVTVHDLAALRESLWVKENSRQVFAKYANAQRKHADAVIAVSEATKRDCISLLNIAPEKITVVYEAAGKNYFPNLDMPFIEKTFGTQKYFLYVGQLQPRKNILNLIAAWARIAQRVPEYKLILVGSARDEASLAEVRAAIIKGGVAGSVILAGRVSNEGVRKLYSGARALVYSSLFEGFGLPIVEALACGIPVITSQISSLPEVAGDAGLLVNPHAIESIGDAIVRVATDEALYHDLKSRVPAQSAKFNWEEAARETIAVYNQLIS